MYIESAQNLKIKNVIKLRNGKERKKQGLIIIEGCREISMALEGGIKFETFFYCKNFINNCHFDDDLSGKKSIKDKNVTLKGFLANARNDNKVLIIKVSEEVFKKISYRDHPDGFLALAKPNEIKLENIKLSKTPFIIIVDKIEKPGNLGAILRTADAVKADAVITCDPKTDLYNPNVIRASMGTLFTNQVVISNADKVINWLKKNKIKIYISYVNAKKIYTEVNYNKSLAIIMGTEDTGLGEEWIKVADEKLRIPMKGKIDSLNVSVSTAIIAYEAIRQRKEKF